MKPRRELAIGLFCCLSSCCLLSGGGVSLSVIPSEKMIIAQEHKDLNLTCQVVTEDNSNKRFDLTWKFPLNVNGISIYKMTNELTVTIHNLREDDSGHYVCELRNEAIVLRKKVSVFVKAKTCKEPFFDCGKGVCISNHYVCDGHIDCPSGYDESFKFCGLDACRNKIMCDGRCISKTLCCDPVIEKNCSANYIMPCCHQYLSQSIQVDPSSLKCVATIECESGECCSLGKSILVIVACCAVIVMLVTSLVMVFVFRHCNRGNSDFGGFSGVFNNGIVATVLGDRVHHSSHGRQQLPFDDVFTTMPDSEPPEDFVLLDFVDGCGFQVADYGPKPPPYTENDQGVPPPPYTSRLDVSAPDDAPSALPAYNPNVT